MKRQIITILSTAVLSAVVAFPALAGTWQPGSAPNEARWWYDNGDGTRAASEWRWIDGNNDGVAECYCFDAEGWLLVNTVTPDNYTVDGNGAWTVNGIVQTQTSAASPSHDQNVAQSGWQQEGGIWRYYKGGQYVTSQWRKISGKKYYFDADGVMATGFQEIDGRKYYFNSDGALKTKNFTLDDVRYIVDEDGIITEELDGNDWETFQSDDYSFGSDSSESSGSSSESPGNSGNSTSRDVDEEAYAKEVFKLVNQERSKAGRDELVWNEELAKLAAERAEELVEKFSHTRPDGSSCYSILSDSDLESYSTVGENIAMGQSSPSSVMDAWMNSSGHKANILNSKYEEIGVGCYEKNGALHWVQLFYTGQ